MATVAVYNIKGGVGKTTIAVNLAWAAATRSARRTLLWDLDAQGAASFLLGHNGCGPGRAVSLFTGAAKPESLITATVYARLNLLPADVSLATLDRELHDIGKKKLLAKMVADLGKTYDFIIFDCPPGLGDLAEQLVRAADLVIVPVVPSELSRRTLASVEAFVNAKEARTVPLLPVHAMVDRRRRLHRDAVANSDWPGVPMASAVEQMAERRAPIGLFAARTSAGQAFDLLWQQVAKRLAQVAR